MNKPFLISPHEIVEVVYKIPYLSLVVLTPPYLVVNILIGVYNQNILSCRYNYILTHFNHPTR